MEMLVVERCPPEILDVGYETWGEEYKIRDVEVQLKNEMRDMWYVEYGTEDIFVK